MKKLTIGMLSATLIASALTGCSGGGAGSSPMPQGAAPTAAPAQTTPQQQRASATMTIALPSTTKTASSSKRHAMYVSPNTSSVRVAITNVDGKSPSIPDTVATLKAGAPGCTTDPSTQALSCTISVAAPTGNNVTFHVTTYASADGTGAVLAEATITKPIVANASNPIAVTLGGVVSTVSFSPANIPVYADGRMHRFQIAVNALDASGATIVGSANYQSPISLSVQGDTNGAIGLSATSISAPGSTFYLTYNAAIPLAAATIVASFGAGADGTPMQTNLHLNPLSWSETSKNQTWTMTAGGAPLALKIHEANFTGTFTVTPSDPGLASIAVSQTDSNGNATVTLTPDPSNSGFGTLTVSDGTMQMPIPMQVNPSSGPQILVNNFPVPSGPDHKQPYHLLSGPQGSTDLWFTATESGMLGKFDIASHNILYYPSAARLPEFMTWGSDGKTIWVAQGDPSAAAIDSFDTTTLTSNHYTQGVAFPAFPYGIVQGPDSKLYFSDRGARVPGIGVFDPANPTAGSTEYRDGMDTVGADNPGAMAFGPDGNLWFADMVCCTGLVGDIGVFDMHTHQITRYSTGLPAGYTDNENGPEGIASDGHLLWFVGFSAYGYIGSIDPSTGKIQLYTTGMLYGSAPSNMVISPDRTKLWYTTEGRNPANNSVTWGIGSFDLATHRATEYNYGLNQTAAHVWSDLKFGPDGNLWADDSVYSQPAIDEVKLH